MLRYLVLTTLMFCHFQLQAQRSKADSLHALLAVEKQDSNRVTLFWNMAIATNAYDPDSSLVLSQKALILARKINFVEGESRALGIMANSFLKIGNYPRALEFYLEKLKIEENRNNARNLASVTMNIGIVYVYQEEFRKALPYYFKADSLIRVNNVEDLKYNIAVNLGDVYNRLESNDSAFAYFRKSLTIAQKSADLNLMGASMVGLGHSFAKAGNLALASRYYHEAIRLLFLTNDENLVCEASLGLAKIFRSKGLTDSARYYAQYTFDLALKDGFISWQHEAAGVLTDIYKENARADSALKYLELAQVLDDSISSNEKVRSSQVLFSNEQLRQAEVAENARRLEDERSQQLQLLFIGIFIPGIFLLTLFLSKRKIPRKFIRTMGVISLLILFEYLLLLLHPWVVHITNHKPIYQIIIYVCVAAILTPTHHRIEHWLIQKLEPVPVPVMIEEEAKVVHEELATDEVEPLLESETPPSEEKISEEGVQNN